MYKMIGADGREYGPVPAEQLRQWIREGRANAQTQVQLAGDTAWKPLGELAEFADLLGAAAAGGAPPVVGPPPTVSAAPSAAINPEALAAEILARDYQVNIGDCIRRAWELFKSDFWLLLGACVVAMLIAGGGGIPYLGALISLVVGGPMSGGLYLFLLKKIRKQPAEFGDIFLGFSTAFVPLMLGYIVSGLLSGIGVLFCIIPGVYLGVAWMFTLALIIDKKLDFWPAMELSRKVVTRHWWQLFGLVLVLGLLTFVGFLACCVGVFVTGTLASIAFMYAYEDIFGARS